jgi:hypothetical protein
LQPGLREAEEENDDDDDDGDDEKGDDAEEIEEEEEEEALMPMDPMRFQQGMIMPFVKLNESVNLYTDFRYCSQVG